MRLSTIAFLLMLGPAMAQTDQNDVNSEIAKGVNSRPLQAYMEGKRLREEREREEQRLRMEQERIRMEQARLRIEQEEHQQDRRIEQEQHQQETEILLNRMEEAREEHERRAGEEGELDLLEKLQLLGKLRDDKVLTEEEFLSLKAQVLEQYSE